MTSEFQTRYELALAAYIEIMGESLPEGASGYFPPPTTMRDKVWLKMLRKTYWRDSHTVKISSLDHAVDAIEWCNENVGFYWTNHLRTIWIFKEKNDAMLFKLTFGGE